jgi:hypothetical protein
MILEAEPKKGIENWSVAAWKSAIQTADVNKKLSHFNDVLAGTEEPSEETRRHLVLADVSIAGKVCDVYHWDQNEDGRMIPGSTVNRVFVHIKG